MSSELICILVEDKSDRLMGLSIFVAEKPLLLMEVELVEALEDEEVRGGGAGDLLDRDATVLCPSSSPS